ncbi:acetyl/propionyl/methylcrotonyl-CoA carboxylase subunit alpha [Afipia broomeae]|uniref:Acetyl-CoA carboxylase, biotin carboxylase subunit n=1 Tax=Afipia broomeae ATCC 49717 TaxID=883078 RepID=K8P1K3_9BRAD|nr:acetyl-CoA carboxylase biotin carboxylase subunit [Afipia broomeae]EKS36477.1 acetyl-CoA carboxylase, biotin carboxylase subunit [Afipia broomeae ATCC 49717]
MNTVTGEVKLTPFRKILIANRGEIALRVIRTAKRLGFETVAVYSTADADARHVREADQAVWIGGSQPSQSYLRIDAIVAAAKASGADAVHPGYGFLAENAEFAKACRDAGLVFIGPSPEAIHAMGHKAGAKDIMQKAGVPCVPGYQGEDQSDDAMLTAAKRIGFPVMIKAVAGGGGRGMRLVGDDTAFPDALRAARSEAQNAFGDPTVILERAIVQPRHIEIQVFGDRHGNAIHLGERDCSVQRRHQKLIEEAPSPAVSPELRARMGATAVAAVKAINYEGAGTLEFLLDSAGNYYFMEMNTRLQVEHPVTEAITGLDLVELQLRVAGGEPLPLQQEDVSFSGHAIEVRLCAEDAAHNFMPQSGKMLRWHAPLDLRVEDALESGGEIPPFYDSMIAKVIGHGTTRDEARRKLIAGLDRMTALGVTTNQSFLARCLDHPAFAVGQATTAFIAEHSADLSPPKSEDGRHAAVAALLVHVSAIGAVHAQQGLGLAHVYAIPLRFELDGHVVEPTVRRERGDVFKIGVAESEHALTLGPRDGDVVLFTSDGVQGSARFVRVGADLYFSFAGVTSHVRDLSHMAVMKAGAAGSDGKLRASMNGRVVSVLAKAGDIVAAGAPVIVLEAMKMQHVHAAPVSGKLMALNAAEGDQVTTGFVVAEIEAVQDAA